MATTTKDTDERTPDEIAANVLRIKAEALKFEAEAADFRAVAAKHEAEAMLAHENEAHIASLRAAQEAQTRQILRQEQEHLAHPRFHHTYHFTTDVNGRTIRDLMGQMDIWHHAEPGCEMRIVFSSPGGSVVDGMALFDYIRGMSEGGHKIVTSTIGYAASMAGILLQAGDERVMGSQAYLLIHQGSFGAGGSVGEVLDTVEWVKKMQSRILDIFASRSKLSKREIARRWERKDWWLDSAESLKLGFVDRIGIV